MADSASPVRRTFRRCAASMAISLAACGVCFAQNQTKPAPAAPTTTPPAPSDAASRPLMVRMSDQPQHIDSVGMSIFLPEGARWEATEFGASAGATIRPPLPDESWLIQIKAAAGKPDQTAEFAAQAAYNALLESVRVVVTQTGEDKKQQKVVGEQHAAIVVESPRLLPKRNPSDPPCARFYVMLPRSDEKLPPVVKGYTVFNTGPGLFVGFELFTSEPDFQKARLYYEATINTAAFVDNAQLTVARAAAIEAGMALLSKTAPADYDAVIADLGSKDGKWFRLYTPAKTGGDPDAIELAYSHVRAWKGRRGELDAGGSGKPVGPEGYIVRVDARYRGGTEFLLDSAGMYFMSPDRSEEVWWVRNTRRDRDPAKFKQIGERAPFDKIATSEETGVRSGRQMTISLRLPGKDPKATKVTVPDRGYLSQVETFLLGPMLVKAGMPLDYAFYAYQSRIDSVSLRWDVLSRPADRLGTWELKTRLREDEPPQISVYDEKGGLIRTTSNAGETKEPIALQRLKQLWESKGLPTQ